MRSAVALGAVACAVIAFWQPEAHPALRLTGARGPLVLSNSSEGRAILTAANLRPGQSVAGSVVLSNRGTAPARLVLRSSPPHGGRLAEVLRLTVSSGRRTVAAGGLRSLAGCHDLGALPAGASRRYRLVARFPRGGRRDNAYARSRVSVDERWTASGAGCDGVAAGPPEPPRLRLVISHRRVLLRRGRVRLRPRCTGHGAVRCRGMLTLRPTALASRLAAAAGAGTRFDVPRGSTRTLLLRLPAASRARLRRRGKAVALALVRPAAGTPLRPTRRYITIVRR